MNNQTVFIIVSTFFEPCDGPMMGNKIEGVFTSLELAEQHLRVVEERDQYSDFIVMSSITEKILDDTIN
jgi:hypothetical protein